MTNSPRNRISAIVLTILVLLGIVQTCYFHAQLPDQVASHFNAAGEADGFSSKMTHTVLMISLQLGLVVMFVGICLATKHMPAGLINIPNREYWLAPERRAETSARLNSSLLWMAAATQLLIMGINQLIIWHNLGVKGMTGGWMWGLVGAFVLFSIGYCVRLMTMFRMPQPETFSSQ